jgi:hypothetical protein
MQWVYHPFVGDYDLSDGFRFREQIRHTAGRYGKSFEGCRAGATHGGVPAVASAESAVHKTPPGATRRLIQTRVSHCLPSSRTEY